VIEKDVGVAEMDDAAGGGAGGLTVRLTGIVCGVFEASESLIVIEAV
jgi:hypothetical protein